MSQSDGSDYEPQYTDVSDVPLGSQDPFSKDGKREALARAESRLEADVNDGEGLPDHLQTPTAADAVENLATYHLLRPATGPGEGNYGTVADYGERQLEYVQTYKQEYHAARDSLLAVGEEVGDEPGGHDPEFQFEAF